MASKRELIEPNPGDKRYVRRDKEGNPARSRRSTAALEALPSGPLELRHRTLEAGLREAQGSFIAIFDADFIPARDFLMRTLPYFESDPKKPTDKKSHHQSKRRSPSGRFCLRRNWRCL